MGKPPGGPFSLGHGAGDPLDLSVEPFVANPHTPIVPRHCVVGEDVDHVDRDLVSLPDLEDAARVFLVDAESILDRGFLVRGTTPARANAD